MDSDMSGEELAETLRKLVPQEHLDFGRKLLADHGVPVDEGTDDDALQRLGWTAATATPQVEVALRHPKMTLIANALGTPPADMIELIHASGRKVAAVAPGRQGDRAGSRPRGRRDRQRWSDRGRAGHGLPGTGSQWLMVEEAENTAVQQQAYADATSRDTVRSRSFTGKPARMLKNDWTEAWETPGNPEPLGMPLQYMVSGMAVKATHKYPDQTVDVAFNPVGQVVGQLTKVEKTRR